MKGLTWYREILALIAGALIPFSLAPYEIWPLGILACGVLAFLFFEQSAKRCLSLGFFCGIGLYSAGVSWVHVSVSQFGGSSPAVALALTVIFIVGLSIFFSLPFYLYGRYLKADKVTYCLGFAAIWVLGEWMRSWFLTGFPWLYVGYAHLPTALSGWAPVFGIFFISLAVALTGAIFSYWIYDFSTSKETPQTKQIPLNFKTASFVILLSLWGLGDLLKHKSWTEISEDPITVGMAQGNIPQEKKWLPSFQQPTIDIFNEVSETLWDNDWVIWPEAAIPLAYHHALPLLEEIGEFAIETDTVFLTGIIYDEPTKRHYYNSIIAEGYGSGEYFKKRLVPFGEYVPMEEHLRGLINFFDLPTSIINIGPSDQEHIKAKEYSISPYICYEIVYPDLVAKQANANVIITISNDAWFGESIGPIQHFEMARMRAMETGRYVIRATNNGISGIINPQGDITIHGGRFTREAIEGKVFPAAGATPFMEWHSWPTVVLILGLLALCSNVKRKNEEDQTEEKVSKTENSKDEPAEI